MRKLAWILYLTLFAVLPASAQKDKRAQDVLDAMSNYYKSLKSYQTAFTYTSAKESYKGDLTVKNKKYRFVLGDQEVVTDGQITSTYLKETNELTIQDHDANTQGELNPTQIYNIYKHGFKYQFLKEQKQGGRTLEVIELTPNQAKSAIAKVQISIDKDDKFVRNWLVVNKDGKQTSYAITKFTPNVNIPDSYFVFDKSKHPGVEVVDLR